MRNFVRILGAAIAALPLSVATQTPDYLAFNDYANEIARTMTSIQSCKRMGFAVRDERDNSNEITENAIRRGVMIGVDRATAETILVGALRRESADMALLASVPSSADTNEALITHFREFFGFWDRRCRSLASEGFGSSYIQITGNEERVQSEMLQNLIDSIQAPEAAQVEN